MQPSNAKQPTEIDLSTDADNENYKDQRKNRAPEQVDAGKGERPIADVDRKVRGGDA